MDYFHPLISKWFIEKYKTPTDIQEKSWPLIAGGKHVLITAPTGSGKTLTAFLWAINELVTGLWDNEKTSVLYISPLKALNNDIKENLLVPLNELKEVFNNKETILPDISVQTRSGDTTQSERQKMLRKPPSILITTPESLNILLTSDKGRLILADLKCVILDEIHAVAGTKRGTHLMTAVERLALLSGEFIRIALSATVRPLNLIADFTGGYKLKKAGTEYIYSKRKVNIIRSGIDKEYRVKVSSPEVISTQTGSVFSNLVNDFEKIIKRNKSTLFFTNSRKLSEKFTRLINEKAGEKKAYSHHGSLSKELRKLVEQKLKKGELKAIVATSSLELGIDIGELDEVILIQPPFSISSAIQKAGRSGHKVGAESKARLYSLFETDIIKNTVTAKAIIDQDIEEFKIPLCPLDVLTQVILSMASIKPWDFDDLFAFIKTAYSYNSLKKEQFKLIIEMLAGKYRDSKIRELNSRISFMDNVITAKKGSRYLLYVAGGTIPDRGYYNLKLKTGNLVIGELDEEFVWERNMGEVFTLGTQSWKIEKIDHQNVTVTPSKSTGAMAPFWKAEAFNRDYHFSEKISLFLKNIGDKLYSPEIKDELISSYCMDEYSASKLLEFLKLQKKHAGIPHRDLIIVEHFQDPLNKSDSKQVILYTMWGGKINSPFSLALSQSWEEKYSYALDIFYDDDCVLLNLPHEINLRTITELINAENLENLLRKKLEKTGLFGAMFRENAARALLLPKMSFNKRMPLWFNRLRSKKLLNAIITYKDFPILAETWRTCLNDNFDLPNLKKLLTEIKEEKIKFKEVFTEAPSPFASNLIWRQTNKYMYEDDTPVNPAVSGLKQDLLKELVFSGELRPQIPYIIIEEFTKKIRRTYPGYAPSTKLDLYDWINDRILIPYDEWSELVKIIESENEIKIEELIEDFNDRLKWIFIKDNIINISEFNKPERKDSYLTAKESLKRLKNALRDNDETLFNLIAEWIRYYGPLEPNKIAKVFGLTSEKLNEYSEEFLEKQIIVVDYITENSKKPEICDTENLEKILRYLRFSKRTDFSPVDSAYLSLFIAYYQGLLKKESSSQDMKDRLDSLFGYPAPANIWEEDIFPARISAYKPDLLDDILQSTELTWFGCGNQRLSFCFESDLELFNSLKSDKINLLPELSGKYTFWQIKDYTQLSSDDLSNKLWENIWKSNISNDSYEIVRKGIHNKFKTFKTLENKFFNKRRGNYNKWKTSRPIPGNWFALKLPEYKPDLMELEEINRDRVYILLARYGILFRELLDKELPALKWSSLFRSLRLMELSGEILSGHFFKDIPGIQFISHNAFQILKNKLPEDEIYWINAADPASVCGIRLEIFKNKLPKRLITNHLVFHGKELVLISEKKGKNLIFYVAPTDINISRYLDFFKIQLKRQFKPLNKITVELVNKTPVLKSPYLNALTDFGFVKDYKGITLRPLY